MDGVLCDSEDRSRQAAVELFKELGFEVTEEDFIPFMGTGEANFLGGVARKFGIPDWDVTKAKARFFEIYIGKVGRAANVSDWRIFLKRGLTKSRTYFSWKSVPVSWKQAYFMVPL